MAAVASVVSLGAAAATRSWLRPPPPTGRSRRGSGSIRANRIAAALAPGDESDPLLRSAVAAASIRHRESLRADPLFIDPYAGCLLSADASHPDMEESTVPTTGSFPSHYRVATKYIDDKLLSFVNRSDDLRQIVLLADGMDTRPYRLNWPRSSIFYDVSHERIFKVASRRLKGVGAKVSQGCLHIRIPLESSNLLESFCRNGFNGGRPSIWALQGLPLSTLASLNYLLLVLSSLAIKGSIFLGELPACFEGNKFEDKTAKEEWLEKLFMMYGFRVSVVNYEEAAKEMHFSPDAPLENSNSILFVAEQLRLSDAQGGKEVGKWYLLPLCIEKFTYYADVKKLIGLLTSSEIALYPLTRSQMEIWRTHFERIEEEGDEEGFEEL